MEYLGGDVALATTASLGGDAAPSELHDAGADFPGEAVRALLAWLLRPHFHVNKGARRAAAVLALLLRLDLNENTRFR